MTKATMALTELAEKGPDVDVLRQMLKTARTPNPDIVTVVRTHNEEEARLLKRDAETVFFGEEELAKGMIGHVLERYGKAQRLPATRHSGAAG